MNVITTKSILTILFYLIIISGYSQTFSTYDSFSRKPLKKEIVTEAYIIKLVSERINDKIVISGELLDKETNSPLSGVTIKEKGTINGTITNNNGEFKLQTSTKNPVLGISYVGFNEENVNTPEVDSDNGKRDKSITSLSGLFVTNFGEESTFQPNIILSQGWKIGRHGIELRIMGLQNNKDTIQLTNGYNLIKPEISKFNFRLTGDFIPFKKADKLSSNAEINIYKQQLNQLKLSNQKIQSNDISSFLLKLTAGYRPTDGIHLYASGVYYKVFEGVQYYEERFGSKAVKNFWNYELSGKFVIRDGAFKGIFIQALYNINSSDYKNLLDTKDSGIFLIRMGFNKELSR